MRGHGGAAVDISTTPPSAVCLTLVTDKDRDKTDTYNLSLLMQVSWTLELIESSLPLKNYFVIASISTNVKP
ncbi:hypothetical protein BaRGS_00028912 [Batillaria attramentaria]|uniref:Uncharacterized protein n=1 Tax=Batillaria attramentaria TaxID=370345 RepID=A0ABD0JXV4_9CAEN